MYDVSILTTRAAELGLQPIDVWRLIEKLPRRERISQASVYRVFDLHRGKPDTLKPIAKVLGLELNDLVIREEKTA